MKTAGKVTATLLFLLSLYVLAYWLLFKKGWLYESEMQAYFRHSDAGYLTEDAIQKAFTPIKKLDWHLNVVIPMRNELTGHWDSNTTNDFVTINPNQQCQLQLGDFIFDGKVEWDEHIGGLSAEFQHQGRLHIFQFIYGYNDKTISDPDPFRSHHEQNRATASIKHTTNSLLDLATDYEVGLTKHPSITPTP